MRLVIPRGMAPAAEVDRVTSQYRCRPCANRSERIVLVVNEANDCVDCGGPITTVTEPVQMAHAGDGVAL